MARNLYGATSADFTLTSGGRVVPGATMTLWTARTGGTQITDLTDRDGVAATSITSGADGSIVYYGPDSDKDVHWADTGVGSRIAVRPTDITGDPPVLSIGTVGTGAAAATLTGTSEAPVLNLTLPSAGANGVDTAAIQDGAVTAAKLAVQPGNLLTANQASIETDTTGWLIGAGTATLSRSTSFQLDGAACLRAAVTANGTILVYATPDITVLPGETYTLEAWFRVGTSNRTCYPYLSWRDSGGSSLGVDTNGPATMCMQGEWTRIQVTGTAPANAAKVRPFLRVSSPENGDYIYFDRMGLWKGAGGQWQPPGVPIIGLEDGNAKVGNLLTSDQASLESGDISGWVSNVGNPTLTRSTTQYLHGSASLRIEATADATLLVYASPKVQVRPGQNYTLTASFRPTSTRDCYPYVSWYDSSGASLGSAAPTAVSCTGSTWTTVQHTGTAPATAVEGRFFLRVNSAVTGDYIYVDKVGMWAGAGGSWVMPRVPVPYTGIRPNPANTSEVQIWNDITATWITV